MIGCCVKLAQVIKNRREYCFGDCQFVDLVDSIHTIRTCTTMALTVVWDDIDRYYDNWLSSRVRRHCITWIVVVCEKINWINFPHKYYFLFFFVRDFYWLRWQACSATHKTIGCPHIYSHEIGDRRPMVVVIIRFERESEVCSTCACVCLQMPIFLPRTIISNE